MRNSDFQISELNPSERHSGIIQVGYAQLNRLPLEVQKCFFVRGGDDQYAFFIFILLKRNIFTADTGTIVESPDLIVSFIRDDFTGRGIKSLIRDDIANVNPMRAAKFNKRVAVFTNSAEKNDWFFSPEFKVV